MSSSNVDDLSDSASSSSLLETNPGGSDESDISLAGWFWFLAGWPDSTTSGYLALLLRLRLRLLLLLLLLLVPVPLLVAVAVGAAAADVAVAE